MRILAIKSDNLEKELAYLYYYENSKTFYIEIPKDADEWELPLLISSCVKKKIYTLNPYYSKLWVEQRIVPKDRQNLGHILKANKLKEYDEFKMLMLSNGRCEQDDYYLVEMDINNLPKEIKDRSFRRMKNLVSISEDEVMVEFADDRMAICRLSLYAEKMEKLINEKHDYYDKCKLTPGGFYYLDNKSTLISSEWIYENSVELPIKASNFNRIIPQLFVSTTELKEEYNCSRQNIDDLVKREKLHPIDKAAQSKLFLSSDVNNWKWQ